MRCKVTHFRTSPQVFPLVFSPTPIGIPSFRTHGGTQPHTPRRSGSTTYANEILCLSASFFTRFALSLPLNYAKIGCGLAESSNVFGFLLSICTILANQNPNTQA